MIKTNANTDGTDRPCEFVIVTVTGNSGEKDFCKRVVEVIPARATRILFDLWGPFSPDHIEYPWNQGKNTSLNDIALILLSTSGTSVFHKN